MAIVFGILASDEELTQNETIEEVETEETNPAELSAMFDEKSAGPFGKGKKRKAAKKRKKPMGTPESRRKRRIEKLKLAIKRLPELIKNETDSAKKKVRVRRLGELKETLARISKKK